jgi:NhaP-type Na+/H+ or K+/H+ antiporter
MDLYSPAVAVSLVLGLGMVAQLVANRLRFPAIVLLLVSGLLVGPVCELLFGWKLLAPALTFEDLLLPGVSLAVGIILFEGGMSLRLHELRDHGHVVRNLCTVGVAITWGFGALALWGLDLLSWQLALLLGALLVVTGPTVIVPLLQQVRPRGPVEPLLRWEGIVVDPIGATLAVLVFEVLVAGSMEHGGAGAVRGLLVTALGGGALGALSGYGLAVVLRRHWVPDFLENGVALALALIAFSVSNGLQEESGLLTVTVMGIVLANSSPERDVKHITEFLENLRVVIISALFILLAAWLDPADIQAVLDWRVFVFLAVLLLVIRPLSVLASSFRSSLDARERIFLAAVAPRGIVAAAVASLFGVKLIEAGVAEARFLGPLTFVVIIGSVLACGLAIPLAYRLGLAQRNPQGFLILGARPWSREMARVLQENGVLVELIDTNRRHVSAARLDGLRAHHANVLSEFVLEELDLGGIGRLLAMTANDDVNTLATERFAGLFGRAQVYQVAPRAEGSRRHDATYSHRVRYAFSEHLTHDEIEWRVRAGYRVKTTRLGEEFGFEEWRQTYGDEAIPLFLVRGAAVEVFAVDKSLEPRAGDLLIGLVRAPGDGESAARAASA